MDKTADEAVSADAGTSDETQESTSVEASVDEETSGETEDSSADEGEKSEDKWLVPGRFKTADDVLRSYNHLESEYGRTQNEITRLRKETSRPQRDPKVENEQFLKELKEDPVEAIRKFTRDDSAMQEIKRIQFTNEHNRLMQNEEYKRLEPTMTELADQYKDMILTNGMQNDPRLLHILYLAAKGASQKTDTAEAEKRGVKKGEADALKKKKAQLEGSSGSKGKIIKPFTELTREEMRKQLGEKKPF